MTIREQTEEIERKTLHPKASLSANSKGRTKPEKEGEIRTCFQRDRDRIIHSKAFRRLKHKTQVFLAPKGDHYRTRLTHVLEVSQIARTISRALRLNEDLTEAIALGHDLGHTPFGHAGEAILREIHPEGFDHYKQSLRVVDFLEQNGKGLNLTYEVRNGIVKHSKGKGMIIPETKADRAETLEGQVVRVSDIIAYVNHDLDDAIRAGVIKRADIPKKIVTILGETHSGRIDRMVKDFIYQSLETGLEKLSMSSEVSSATYMLRDFLYERVYESDTTKIEFRKAKKILGDLYEYYLEHIEEVFKNIPAEKKLNKHRMVCDFVAGMTDRFAMMTYERLFLPQQWMVV
ncbi:MAG: deoxyguanosinetriphosphate triphosphohydrolase [Nitrospirae bacterium GWF2_44_13]|nr:MAG: deoxyguanosinetriphosphate triphosphohydrolase [Nitrospirae bacterium GWF2_44_13]OGW33843.1 MAG: deoxyguanosinetriphosphate triphosphohydrolase [Nitrospirae bacterium GWD2_44_7]OGW64187.1 MAG: deoxyguanosinetriphosphate triphosphohydrolase [Nitrospirae bacterium RIFOXYA2_FULL_44_9]OGW73385.1 MAG: deoxyguanosinetriphosphate triphosphohydrolase [Nitrospirae bacterium RIFOXYC2_FULL_44_7]HBG92845.1 deoxyguanosinetriphosphate triphosphohydrolase [Nitrospiraceae bacterium]